jgi:hypothetical protein
MARNIKTTRETATGLNTHFSVGGRSEIPRGKLVNEIKRGEHPDYHVMNHPSGKQIPRSNPDRSHSNNLD